MNCTAALHAARRRHARRHAGPCALVLTVSTLAALQLSGCTAAPARPDAAAGGAGHGPQGAPAGVAANDVLWLERITYGLTTQTLTEYRQEGRTAFLARQLREAAGAGNPDARLPREIAAQIDGMEITHLDPAQTLARVAAEYKRIRALPDGDAREQARRSLNEEGNRYAYQARRRELLRAIYSPDPLREQLVDFWLNHFSVFEYKGEVRWLAGDYAEHAIRPHVLGRFGDLVMSTLTHPAMLQYLDNARNAAGHVNENYARELMELHTLGVDGGYTQQDVQNLARILTGVGVYTGGEPPPLRREWQGLYRRAGAFEFNPARHDFGDKTLLGRRIEGRGFAEVEQAVDLLVRSPACARFIARKLAVHFVSDTPSPALIERAAQRFQSTHGDLAAVMAVLLNSPEFIASLGHKFKDPRQYVVSSLRLAYDGRPIANTHPPINWLASMGEAQFGRQTPDGYPDGETGWASSGQMARRFEIARAIGSGSAGLFEPEDGGAPTASGFPQIARRIYFDALEPLLSASTRQALDQANSQQEWNTFLLSSPEFNDR